MTSTLEPTRHVIIVGAGLAGPALAAALASRGFRTTILERHPAPRDIGGVILVAPNAMRVLDKLVGIEPRLRAVGCSYDAIDIYTEASSSFTRVGGFWQTSEQVQGLTIARPALHDILLERCREYDDGRIDIRYGSKLVRVDEQEDAVYAVLEDGTRIEGDMLIGADGIGSPVRQHILDGQQIQATYSGVLSLGCVLPRSQVILPPGLELPAFLYTRHGTILVFAMDKDTIQWATTSPVAERDRHEWEAYRTSGQAVAQLESDWSGCTLEPIASMLQHVTNDNIRLWAPYQVPELARWHTSRTCVLGDAAHAVPPSLGQGAAQAFEDVGVMARLLTTLPETTPPCAIFSQFESLRRPRVDMIRKMTASAESTRGASSSSLGWFVKDKVIKASFMMMGKGKGSYMSNATIGGYDATSIDVKV